VDKEKRIKFGKLSPPDPDQGIFKMIPQHCATAFPHNLAYISRERDRIFIKIIPQM